MKIKKIFLSIFSLAFLTTLTSCGGDFSIKSIDNEQVAIVRCNIKTSGLNPIEEIAIPAMVGNKKVTTIKRNAFTTNYKNIIFPSSIKTIDEDAFNISLYGTSHNVYYQGTIEDWCSIDMGNRLSTPLLEKGTLYFRNDENGEHLYNGLKYDSLTNLNIPSTVKTIKPYLFRNIVSLESVNLGDTVVSVGDGAFFMDPQLDSLLSNITFGSNIKSLGKQSFAYNLAIENLVLNDGLETIDEQCFYHCYNVEWIVLPNTLTNIANTAFDGMSVNLNLFYKGNLEEWNLIEKAENFYSSYNLYFYSDEVPAIEGNYWHYDDNNLPTIW